MGGSYIEGLFILWKCIIHMLKMRCKGIIRYAIIFADRRAIYIQR